MQMLWKINISSKSFARKLGYYEGISYLCRQKTKDNCFMNTTIKEEDNNLVMEFDGRLDTLASGEVGKQMQALYNCEGHNIVLDMTKLEYISSSGLRLLLELLKVAQPKGSRIFVKGISQKIRNVLEMAGFMNFFKTID